ncbi:MAG: hypothetical protein CM15mP106_2510 [Candidatus Neomarinimicrobiota bacterium]|nr:MAG: hypothetical protein CM15mP106_2510 [Candidatus Neomarinimicrobiota bacterium]
MGNLKTSPKINFFFFCDVYVCFFMSIFTKKKNEISNKKKTYQIKKEKQKQNGKVLTGPKV